MLLLVFLVLNANNFGGGTVAAVLFAGISAAADISAFVVIIAAAAGATALAGVTAFHGVSAVVLHTSY